MGNRTDANHADLRDNYFRKLASVVVDCSQFGCGFADLLVKTSDGQLYLVEIKDGSKRPSARRLTTAQKKVAYELGDRFLVASNGTAAVDICTVPQIRHIYNGIDYDFATHSRKQDT